MVYAAYSSAYVSVVQQRHFSIANKMISSYTFYCDNTTFINQFPRSIPYIHCIHSLAIWLIQCILRTAARACVWLRSIRDAPLYLHIQPYNLHTWGTHSSSSVLDHRARFDYRIPWSAICTIDERIFLSTFILL